MANLIFFLKEKESDLLNNYLLFTNMYRIYNKLPFIRIENAIVLNTWNKIYQNLSF